MVTRLNEKAVRMSPKSSIYVSIQVLRAVAATLVIIDHIILSFDPQPMRVQHIAWLIGSYGVYIFFLISGFLMVETSQNQFGKRNGPIVFLRKRFVRIVPLYWIFTTFILAGSIVGHHSLPTSRILTSYFFLPSFGPDGTRPILGVGWTLNYEMFFYMLFAAVIIWKREIALKILALVFAVIIISGSVGKSLIDTRDAVTTFEFFTDPIILLFGAGCLISAVRSRWEVNVGLPASNLIPVIVVFASLLGTVLFIQALSQSETLYPLSLGQELILWSTAALVVAILSRREAMPTSIYTRFLVFLGNASYSIYLSHSTAIRYASRLIGGLREHHPVELSLMLFVISITFGIVVHLAIEIPLLRLMKPRDVSIIAVRPLS